MTARDDPALTEPLSELFERNNAGVAQPGERVELEAGHFMQALLSRTGGEAS
jgi:hypothetical protein